MASVATPGKGAKATAGAGTGGATPVSPGRGVLVGKSFNFNPMPPTADVLGRALIVPGLPTHKQPRENAFSRVQRVLARLGISTANEETPHVNFFTLNQLEHLFAENGMKAKRMYAFFSWWTLWETLFSERKVPAIWPEQNFRRSMDMHPRRCAEWAFLLRKTGTAMGSH